MSVDLQLSSYDYELPEKMIAQEACVPAHHAKMLCINGDSFVDKQFCDLPQLLAPNTVLFFNQTKVYRARIPLQGVKIQRKTGKFYKVDGEIFVYHIRGPYEFEVIVSDDKNFRPGSNIFFGKDIVMHSQELIPNGIVFSIEGMDIYSFLEKYAQMPLPPYISYDKSKEKDYQTYFAKDLGSAAAPTASLHFTAELLAEITKSGMDTEFATLHVGLGTFRPVFAEDIASHAIHGEYFLLDDKIFEKIAQYKQNGKEILAVGTTMARYLETLPYVWKVMQSEGVTGLGDGPIPAEVSDFRNTLTENIDLETAKTYFLGASEHSKTLFQTKLFIYPGFERKLVDQLITNFHLPKSSLLMLVSSFMGRKEALAAYEYAKSHTYKFYSFGDGMWIEKKNH